MKWTTLQDVMKNIEEMKSKIENLSNKLTGNVTTTQVHDKIVQTQPLSALKKTTGTHPSKTTQFQVHPPPHPPSKNEIQILL